jgi:hypothetical protein
MPPVKSGGLFINCGKKFCPRSEVVLAFLKRRFGRHFSSLLHVPNFEREVQSKTSTF